MLLWCISCLKSEFCNQLFGSVPSFSIRCNTTFFCFCVLFVFPQWLLFSQNSFIIAPHLFSVLCMSVFGLQCGCKCFWVAAVNRRQQWRQIWIASAVVWALSWWCPWCFQGLLIRYWWKAWKLWACLCGHVSCCEICSVTVSPEYLRFYQLVLFKVEVFPSWFLHWQISVNREW